MKKLVCILLVLFGILPIVSAIGETRYCIVNPNSYLNIREKPSKRSDSCGMLYFGDEVEVISVKNGWAFCDYATEVEYGYVKVNYLSLYELELVNKTMVVNSKARVALRDSIEGKRVKWVNGGEKLHIYCITGDWAITKNWRFIKTEYLADLGE